MAGQSDDEQDAYWLVRYRAARRAGLTKVEAHRFANGTTTLHVLQRCVDGGAKPEQIARVVT